MVSLLFHCVSLSVSLSKPFPFEVVSISRGRLLILLLGGINLASFVLEFWDRQGQRSPWSECTFFLHFSVFCLCPMSDLGYADISGDYPAFFLGGGT